MDSNYSEQTGRIFDIQKFSIHDGPGIRTIVFLKGCLFRCRWCCNPESQEFAIQNMLVDGKQKIMGQDTTVAEVIAQVEQDRPYYRRSRGGLGGMTLSGGECMCQPEFAHALLYTARQKGITTAIETTAAVEWDIVEKVISETDYVLMDIKHMDGSKHKEYIGRDNVKVLENAKKIAQAHNNLTIRVPVVPGFNDKPEEIREIARFAKSLPGVHRLHLLPYHRLGRDKYTGLDRAYLLDEILPPPAEHMQKLLSVVQAAGLDGQIGG